MPVKKIVVEEEQTETKDLEKLEIIDPSAERPATLADYAETFRC